MGGRLPLCILGVYSPRTCRTDSIHGFCTRWKASSTASESGSFRSERLPHLFKAHEPQRVATGFLVTMHQCEDLIEAGAVPRCRQTEAGEQRPCVVHRVTVKVPGQARQLGGIDHANGHGVAVTPAEMLELFDCMTEGVAVVEEFTQSGLPEICAHMMGLHTDGALDELTDHILQRRAQECLATERAQFGGMVLEDAQDLRIHDEPGFRHLAQPLR